MKTRDSIQQLRTAASGEIGKLVRDSIAALGFFTIVAGGSSFANGAAGVLESSDRTIATIVLAMVFSGVVAFNLAFLRHLRTIYASAARRRPTRR